MKARTVGRARIDGLGAGLTALAAGACVWLPFVLFKANRILPGEPRALLEVLPAWAAVTLSAVLAVAACTALFAARPLTRLIVALVAIGGVCLAVGAAADALTPAGDRVVRVSPGAACWVLLVALGLLAADALASLQPRPWLRALGLGALLLAVTGGLSTGYFDDLSIMREYAVNAARFAQEARRHVLLAFGSLLAAAVIGVPAGLLCHRRPGWRTTLLAALNVVQTVPSIALFGLLMSPLAALAAAVPWLGQHGISGIGAAPAFVALTMYSLLPVVANTVLGLSQVPPAVVDAADGMGYSEGQRLRRVELPLAMPTILTGLRIALVQNIGLVTVAALIGGGGLGAFVFQGIGQTATDLVLLGALPTVALALAASVLFDACIAQVRGGSR